MRAIGSLIIIRKYVRNGSQGVKLTKLFPSQVLFVQFGFSHETVDFIFVLNLGEVIPLQLQIYRIYFVVNIYLVSHISTNAVDLCSEFFFLM